MGNKSPSLVSSTNWLWQTKACRWSIQPVSLIISVGSTVGLHFHICKASIFHPDMACNASHLLNQQQLENQCWEVQGRRQVQVIFSVRFWLGLKSFEDIGEVQFQVLSQVLVRACTTAAFSTSNMECLVSPPMNLKRWTLQSERLLSLTTSANHCSWTNENQSFPGICTFPGPK